MFWIILLVIVAFSLLVIAHEFGHFIVAKRNGIKVYEFGIGFPPKAWGIKRGGTEYTINWLPLGGFVRLEGEDNESKTESSFATKSVWVKTKVLMAGVTMNFLIAWVIFTGLCLVGIANIFPFPLPSVGPIAPVASEAPRLVAFSIAPGSAAEKAGLQTGDAIISLDGQKPTDEQVLRTLSRDRSGKVVELVFTQKGTQKSATVQLGSDVEKGILGVVALPQVRERYVWWVAPIAGLLLMGKVILVSIPLFFSAIGNIIFHAKVGDGLVGPIGIAAAAPQMVQFGWDYFFALIASISLSLGILNALPIPALDGGRLALILLRKAGIPLNEKHETWAHFAGFVALIGLGIIVAISDVSRLWR